MGAVDDFDVIVALWARSLMWQQQQEQQEQQQQQQQHSETSSPPLPPRDAVRIARRLLLLSHPSDDDVVFMCDLLTACLGHQQIVTFFACARLCCGWAIGTACRSTRCS